MVCCATEGEPAEACDVQNAGAPGAQACALDAGEAGGVAVARTGGCVGEAGAGQEGGAAAGRVVLKKCFKLEGGPSGAAMDFTWACCGAKTRAAAERVMEDLRITKRQMLGVQQRRPLRESIGSLQRKPSFLHGNVPGRWSVSQ